MATAALAHIDEESFPTVDLAHAALDHAALAVLAEAVAQVATDGIQVLDPYCRPQVAPVTNGGLIQAYTLLRPVLTSTEVRKRLRSALLLASSRRFVVREDGSVFITGSADQPYLVGPSEAHACEDIKHRDSEIAGLCKHVLLPYLVSFAQRLYPNAGKRRWRAGHGLGLTAITPARARTLLVGVWSLLDGGDGAPSFRLTTGGSRAGIMVSPDDTISVRGERLSTADQDLIFETPPLSLMIGAEAFLLVWEDQIRPWLRQPEKAVLELVTNCDPKDRSIHLIADNLTAPLTGTFVRER